jgi:hypothetical protein
MVVHPDLKKSIPIVIFTPTTGDNILQCLTTHCVVLSLGDVYLDILEAAIKHSNINNLKQKVKFCRPA